MAARGEVWGAQGQGHTGSVTCCVAVQVHQGALRRKGPLTSAERIVLVAGDTARGGILGTRCV